MRFQNFWRAGVSGAVLAVALILPATAQAQQGNDVAPAADELADADLGDAIIVEGIRGSLDRALTVKREADSVVDAISAEDVGKFPDVNIAESVQRITGVQINRTRGEGRTVNIRGLPSNFTQTTFNGRALPNANGDSAGSRTFDFMVLPPEFVRTLAVYKSVTADQQDGGLAGTVDIKTPRPFDINRRVLSAALQAEYEANSGKVAPRASAFFSDTFADDRLGLSLGISYTRRKPQTQNASAGYTTSTEANGIPSGSGPDDLNGNGIIEPTLRVRVPNQINYYMYDEDNRRLSGVGSLQYRASDNLTLSLDGFYSKLDVEAVTNEFLQIFANANRVVSATTEVIDGLPTTTRLRVADLDMRGGGRFEDRRSSLYSVVGGARYEADGWLINLEGARAVSRQHLDNLNIADIATGEAEFISRPGDTLWSMNYYNGFDQRRLDPNSYRVASLNGELNRTSSDELWDAKLDVTREFGNQGLTAIRFGGQYSDRKFYQDNYRLTVSAAGVSALAGGLPAGPTPGSFSAASFMKRITAGRGSYLGSYSGDAVFATEWIASDTRAFISRFSDEQLIAASPNSLTNDATGITDVHERTLAGYVRADFAFGQLSGNIGTRAVRTWQTTVGVSPDLTAITVQPDAGNITRVPASAPAAVDRAYWDLLPSLNLKWQATDKLLMRFSASRTITRPTLSEISPTTTASGTARTVTQNNPYLDPFRANNLDATAEWYFSKDGLLGAALFYKDLKSLIRRETTVQTLPITYLYSNGTQQAATLDFTFSRLVNGKGVTVKGFELYYQQAFTGLPAPLDGLGTILNYTFIDNSDPTQLTAASKHNFNATGYYEKGPIGVRLSYSWRSGFLSSAAVAPAMSQYTRPYGTLDGSINVKLNDRFSLVLEAVNILDTDERVRYTSGLPQAYLDAGKRFFGGIRVAL
ncbi:MAG: TonB-dependent receptor [Sphingomonadales bacterium]|nr:TonB-dependent receptor [Sphingomonadales bacterium]